MSTTNDCTTPGTVCSWDITDTDSGKHLVFEGTLLGAGSSMKRTHDHYTDRACSACRWFEVKIIRRNHGPNEYVVVYEGHTTIEGETLRCTVHQTQSPHAVLEVLTQQRGAGAFIPRTSRLALAEAAGRDEGIEAAWIDRAV